ncbi:hypothetical protein AAKU58_000175 [Oxalobacteraceae bacterium GrIS 1.18]
MHSIPMSTSSFSSSSSSSYPSSSSSSSSSLSSSSLSSRFEPMQLDNIPEYAQKLLSTMDKSSVSNAIAGKNLALLNQYSRVLHYLPPEKIKDYLKPLIDDGDWDNPLIAIENSPEYCSIVSAYIDIYLRLAERLPKKNFALIAFPFLSSHSGTLVMIGLEDGYPEILDKCAQVWKWVDPDDFSTGSREPGPGLRATAREMLIGLELDFGDGVNTGSPETIFAFGRFLQAASLDNDLALFETWAIGHEKGDQKIFLDLLVNGKAANIHAYVELLKPVASHRFVASILENIDTAEKIYQAKKTALDKIGQLQTRLLKIAREVESSSGSRPKPPLTGSKLPLKST